MHRYNDTMDHYDQDMQDFYSSKEYKDMHTRNNMDIELMRRELPAHLQIFFNRLLDQLSNEYAATAEAAYEAGLEHEQSLEDAYEK